MTNQTLINNHCFENIRHTDDEGNEYWLARQLSKTLEYSEFRHFLPVIDRAKDACKNSGLSSENHFEEILAMVNIGSGAQRELSDIKLSRYACYLIVQNGDPSKPIIANGQTYFAIQTRRQELQDNVSFSNLTEDERRLLLRHDLTAHNKTLSATAKQSGVTTPLDYAIFQDHGYKGLYAGLTTKDIHGRKGLSKNQKILDHMGSTELAANLFRATQTEDKLRRDKVQDKAQANSTHFEVGQKVRKTIHELGGTMPENLETRDKSIKQIEHLKAKKLDQHK